MLLPKYDKNYQYSVSLENMYNNIKLFGQSIDTKNCYAFTPPPPSKPHCSDPYLNTLMKKLLRSKGLEKLINIPINFY